MTRKVLRLGRGKQAGGVEEKIGLSASHIQDIANPRSPRYDPTFPKFVSLGKRAVGLFDDELDAWLSHRPRVDPIVREKQFLPLQEGRKRFRENQKSRKQSCSRRREAT